MKSKYGRGIYSVFNSLFYYTKIGGFKSPGLSIHLPRPSIRLNVLIIKIISIVDEHVSRYIYLLCLPLVIDITNYNLPKFN